MVVRQRVISLTEGRQREALQRLRGSSAGKGLLDKLLADRLRERARAHKDPEFHSLAGEVKQHTLPPKSNGS